MGNYSVPESIRRLKPKGTMVKNISGHYYVYEYSNYTDDNGKRHTKMGKSIGSIKEGIGFIPNSTFAYDSEISSLDFGEYAITLANSTRTLERTLVGLLMALSLLLMLHVVRQCIRKVRKLNWIAKKEQVYPLVSFLLLGMVISVFLLL